MVSLARTGYFEEGKDLDNEAGLVLIELQLFVFF